jgi:hypothetical protein
VTWPRSERVVVTKERECATVVRARGLDHVEGRRKAGCAPGQEIQAPGKLSGPG